MSPAREQGDVFDLQRFIDRVAETELFLRMLAFESESRVLTICDRSGRGKSQLLKALRYPCQYSAQQVHAVLLPLHELPERTPHGHVRVLAQRLRDDGVGFPRLDEVDRKAEALQRRERAEMAQEAMSSVSGGLNAPGMAVAPEGIAGGTVIMGGVTIVQNSALAANVPETIRDQALEAFIQDLSEVGATRPVVLLFDAYEKCGELDGWLTRFLRRTVVDPSTRVEHLIVVLAGQRVPSAGLRLLLGDRFENVVESLDSLSLWGHEHVKAFLDLNDVRGYDDRDVDWIVGALERGVTLGSAVGMVRQFLREASQAQ